MRVNGELSMYLASAYLAIEAINKVLEATAAALEGRLWLALGYALAALGCFIWTVMVWRRA